MFGASSRLNSSSGVSSRLTMVSCFKIPVSKLACHDVKIVLAVFGCAGTLSTVEGLAGQCRPTSGSPGVCCGSSTADAQHKAGMVSNHSPSTTPNLIPHKPTARHACMSTLTRQVSLQCMLELWWPALHCETCCCIADLGDWGMSSDRHPHETGKLLARAEVGTLFPLPVLYCTALKAPGCFLQVSAQAAAAPRQRAHSHPQQPPSCGSSFPSAINSQGRPPHLLNCI